MKFGAGAHESDYINTRFREAGFCTHLSSPLTTMATVTVLEEIELSESRFNSRTPSPEYGSKAFVDRLEKIDYAHGSAVELTNESALPPVDRGFGAWSFVRVSTRGSLLLYVY